MKAVFSTIIFLCISLFSFSFSPIQKGQDTIIYSNEDFIILNDLSKYMTFSLDDFIDSDIL